MRTSKIAFAVATALAAVSASAANHDIYISGASAQRDFWTNKFLTVACGSGSAITTYKAATLPTNAGGVFTVNVSNADFRAFRCTGTGVDSVVGSATVSPLIPASDTITVHYSAELGSAWGILNGLARNPDTSKRLFLEPGTGSACGGGNCPATAAGTYNYNNDTISPDAAGLFVRRVPDIVVTDLEPQKWSFSDNWPTFTQFGAVPTKTALTTLTGTGATLIGQLFAVVTANSTSAVPMPFTLNGLSKTSISNIFQGYFTKWTDVPEARAAGYTGPLNIKVCRRDHGSGSQVAASVTFIGAECGLSVAHPFVTKADSQNLATVADERPTGGQMQACVLGTQGAIGFASFGTFAASNNYNFLAIDGVQANAHNAAAGAYPFAYETWGAKLSGGAGDQTLAQAFVDSIQVADTVSADIGGETGTIDANSGLFVVTGGAANTKGYYSLPYLNGTDAGVITSNGALPTSGFTLSGESCGTKNFIY